ncbi:ATP-binding protein [Bradyrhizobium sp. Ai1a-2]|uniref:ATP-binding protein n=1 Tax=Bradyrhizobium sp. Ai1a-2 TaxID=196490 RepID=UPI0004834F06|nr:ATP-binding protein [Bradyrhizobium sp. Ai1a-2]
MALLLRLFALVAFALLPGIAIQLYNELDLRFSHQMEVQELALGLAKLAAAEQQQIIQGIRQALIALSELPAIKAKDVRGCEAYLARIRERYPEFINFIVVDTNGDSFCDSSIEYKPSTAAGRGYFVSVLKTGKFTVGEFAHGRTTGRNVLHFALPFYDDDGHIGGVVIAALSLDWLAHYLAQKGTPPGAVLAIRDRNGTYLARYPGNDHFVGRTIPDDPYLHSDRSGTTTARDIDGVERIVGYTVVQADSGELFVTFGLDKALAFSQIHRRTRLGILLIVLGTSLVLALTWFGARRFIQHPLALLVDAANQWRLGDYARRVKIRDKGSELTRVADAFNTMADALANREQELHDAKERAEQAAARITTIFESTTDCVLIVDTEWNITYLNERAKAQLALGYDLVGMNLCEIFPDWADVGLSARAHTAMSEQKSASVETFFRNVWYTVNAFPSGEGIVILFRDITEHKQAVEARRLMEEQLHQSQKMEAVGQLTGGVAHDFNNLLMVISGNLELIESRTGDDEGIRGLAIAARKAAHRGASLTAQLLAFSRRQRLNPKTIRVSALIQDFQGLIHRALGDGCKVNFVAEDQLWLCHVDPAQLETALLNLALNARDAMPDGGRLEIEARNVTLDEGAVAGVASGSYVKLSVTDTGCGMPQETLDRVFEPFFTTKELGKGTGLGLSMVYGFVRQSGGHVTIESTVGVGTTVTLYLPRSGEASEVGIDITQLQDMTAGSGRILMVEDDPDVMDITSAILRELGYEVVCAQDGADAIRILRDDKRFDLLFSDIMMPGGISGVELAREAKQLSSGIKILLTSGNAAEALAWDGAEREFPVIGKPFRRTELAQRLRVVIGAS